MTLAYLLCIAISLSVLAVALFVPRRAPAPQPPAPAPPAPAPATPLPLTAEADVRAILTAAAQLAAQLGTLEAA